MKATIDYYDRPDRCSIHSKLSRSEEVEFASEDMLFEELFKRNNSLRYCSGSYWKFQDKENENKYYIWLKGLSKERSFNLFYGNGIVD